MSVWHHVFDFHTAVMKAGTVTVNKKKSARMFPEEYELYSDCECSFGQTRPVEGRKMLL